MSWDNLVGKGETMVSDYGMKQGRCSGRGGARANHPHMPYKETSWWLKV